MSGVIAIHPSFWQAAVEDGNPHLSPMERMIALLKQDDPNLCDHDAMELIHHAAREEGWQLGPHLVVNNDVHGV